MIIHSLFTAKRGEQRYYDEMICAARVRNSRSLARMSDAAQPIPWRLVAFSFNCLWRLTVWGKPNMSYSPCDSHLLSEHAIDVRKTLPLV